MLAGSKDGSFAAPEKLLDKSGNILRLGQYWDYDTKKWKGVETSKFKEILGIGAAAVDWDDDSDLDLLLGGYDGNFYLRLNEGSAMQPAFATESTMLTTKDDAPLTLSGRDAIPKIVDWNGDGLFDILSGSGQGGVYWLRNVGTKGAPAFAEPEELVRPPQANARAGLIEEEQAKIAVPTWPGQRTQPCAADYDGDGDLDLLVGDCHLGNLATNEMHGYVWLLRRK